MEGKNTLTKEELEEIKDLVKRVLIAPNKKTAETYIGRLEFIGRYIYGYAGNVFAEMVAYVKQATGRVRDKERKADIAMQALYKFLGAIDKEG